MYTVSCHAHVYSGQKAQAVRTRENNGGISSEGFTGLKALGVRDLTYKMAFLSTTVVPAVSALSVDAIH